MPNLTVRANALPISQLTRDSVLRRVFAGPDLGAAPAIVDRRPRPRHDGDAAPVRALALVEA